MSSALRRRFNFVTLPVVGDPETEMAIVRKRTADLMADYQVEAEMPDDLVRVLVTVFQELRQGRTLDGKTKVKSLPPRSPPPRRSRCCSTAASWPPASAAAGSERRSSTRSLLGVVVREDPKDAACLLEYLETVAEDRGGAWSELYQSRRFVPA